MRIFALIPALYLTSTLCACAQPMQEGPPPGYGQQGGGYGQSGPESGGAGQPAAGQPQGWAGGMQAYNGQTPPPEGMPDQPNPGMAPPGMAPPGMGGGHEKFAEKFAAANVTHDGRLTQPQAQAGGMHAVAKHFAQIDRDQKGYVTLQDIKEWHRAMHAEKAARAQNAAPGAGAYPPPGAPAGGSYPPPGAAPAGGQQY